MAATSGERPRRAHSSSVKSALVVMRTTLARSSGAVVEV
jgi:hypothetical protein